MGSFTCDLSSDLPVPHSNIIGKRENLRDGTFDKVAIGP